MIKKGYQEKENKGFQAFSAVIRPFLGLAVLLFFMLRVPGWFTQDEKRKFALFEPDEIQYVEMAVYQVQSMDSTLLPEEEVEQFIFNVRGFGYQIGVIGYVLNKVFSLPLNTANFILIGRILSTIYSIFLLLLVYQLCRLMIKDELAAVFSTLVLALADLNITYSHYALPAISYVFWSFLSVYFILKWFEKGKVLKEKPWWCLVFAGLSAGCCFGTKFDFIPLFFGCVVIVGGFLKGNNRPFSKGLHSSFGVVFFMLAAILGFELITFFNFPIIEVIESYKTLYAENKNVIAQDSHLVHNPIVYVLAVIGGVSFPVFVLAVRGKWKMVSKTNPVWLLVLLFLGMEFGVRWLIDTPFVRRINIFIPFVAIMAASSMSELWRKSGGGRWLVAGVFLYQLIFSLVSQSNFWMDTRYKARAYLQKLPENTSIYYGPYAQSMGMPKGVRKVEEAQLLLIHESFYRRYWKSMTTPFKIPECCEEVYHCRSKEDCLFYQRLLAGEHPDFKLIERFSPMEWAPERLFYQQLLGYYETFLGEVLIFSKK